VHAGTYTAGHCSFIGILAVGALIAFQNAIRLEIHLTAPRFTVRDDANAPLFTGLGKPTRVQKGSLAAAVGAGDLAGIQIAGCFLVIVRLNKIRTPTKILLEYLELGFRKRKRSWE
jgi:hypothetical protein